MKMLPILFRIYFVGLICLCVWTIFGADATTNAANAVTVQTTTPAAAITTVVGPPRNAEQLTFGLHRIPQLTLQLLGIPLWQYIASAIYIVLALLVAKVFDYLITVQLRKLTARTKNTLDDLLINLLHGPLKILVIVGMLWFGLDLFHWPLWLEKWLKGGFVIVLGVALTYLALRLVDLAGTWWANRPTVRGDKAFNDLLIPLISKTVKAFVLIMAILTTLDMLNFNIRTLLAGVSISGLALGLAAQDTVGNLFGAAAVFVDKPFKIGDRIQLNGVDGVVEEMGLRSTRVRNLDGHLITVPNKTMGNATITNVSRRPNIKTVLNIGVTYDTSVEQLRQATVILKDIFGAHEMTQDLIIGVNQFADSAININVIHWWKGTDYKAYVAGMQEMHLEIKRRFDGGKINFAFPSRTIYLKQDSDWRVQELTA